MKILNLIKEIFEPAAKLVDDVHTSKEEKLNAKANMLGGILASYLGAAATSAAVGRS